MHCPEDYNFAYDVIDKLGSEAPSRRAMLWTNDKGAERTFTFGDMRTYSDKAAGVLAVHGIKKGDKVMLILKRHYQFWFAILACHKLGAIAIPATNLLTKKDLEYRFNIADIKAVVCTAEGNITDHINDAQPNSPTMELKFTVNGKKDGFFDFDEEIEAHDGGFTRPELKASDPMLLYFTSGTTGYPKMVMHDNTYTLGHIATAKHWHNVRPDGLHLTLSETGWAKSVWGKLYGQWLMEAGIFVYDYSKFAPKDLLPIFSKYKITTFCAPPTIFRFLIQEDLTKFDLSALEYATIAGEALNPEVFNRFYEATGIKLMEAFGQTEATVMIANTVGMEPKPGSMGKPNLQYDMVVVDEDGKEVDAGVTGELCIRVEGEPPFGLFRGYYKNEQQTESVWHDGLYHTGDTTWRDEDGYFWYVGRTDDIIKSSGYRIGPFEIESVLMEHPGVVECAVTGVPDELRGQLVKATIVLKEGFGATDELKKEIQDYVKKQTAPYKYPRVIDFVTELPKTISGKIRRVEIRGESKQ
ncbi:MAG TPA: acetyl-CoA synthetase [Ruminococcaceae bacterium]|nr:acetyl-CoA synthetase [Oscillospiraceae bacterium]